MSPCMHAFLCVCGYYVSLWVRKKVASQTVDVSVIFITYGLASINNGVIGGKLEEPSFTEGMRRGSDQILW